VVLVSHDRFFLDRVSTRVLHLEGGAVTSYPGGFADYTGRRKNAAVTVASDAVGPPGAPARAATPSAPPPSRESHEERRRKQREAEKRAKRVAELESQIADGEGRLKALRAQLLDASLGWERLAQLADQEQKLAREVDGWTETWMKLSEVDDG
jgi:ATPase subunit of ABC transporter with duplicated ATPase domains